MKFRILGPSSAPTNLSEKATTFCDKTSTECTKMGGMCSTLLVQGERLRTLYTPPPIIKYNRALIKIPFGPNYNYTYHTQLKGFLNHTCMNIKQCSM